MNDNGFGRHDKHLLILVYKILFQKEYPTSKYLVSFEPKLKFSESPHYRPDILIIEKHYHIGSVVSLENIVLWVEIGELKEDKKQYIISVIGKERLRHISYGHSIFDVSETLNPSTYNIN